MALVFPGKQPTEVLDYDIDWSQRLNGDTITSSSWAVTTTDNIAGSLSIQSNSFLPTRTKVWLTQGTLGYSYILTNTITTANGDTMIENAKLRIITR